MNIKNDEGNNMHTKTCNDKWWKKEEGEEPGKRDMKENSIKRKDDLRKQLVRDSEREKERNRGSEREGMKWEGGMKKIYGDKNKK